MDKMKILESFHWECMWITILGCVKGCANFLNVPISNGWLYGISGHAFVLNIHEELCPSGPTAWNMSVLDKMLPNAGLFTNGVLAWFNHPDLKEKQLEAWNFVRSCIDAGVPVVGWCLDIPEYYIIKGYDDEGYIFEGVECSENKKTLPWDKLGDLEVKLLDVFCVKKAQPAQDKDAVKQALQFAIEASSGSEKYFEEGYKGGLGGYDNWIKALEQGKANPWGAGYNSACWQECRELAVEFLKEAKQKIPGIGSLFDNAIANYETVSKNLTKVAEMFPFIGLDKNHVKDSIRVQTAVNALKEAKTAETAGVESLKKIVDKL